MVKSVKAIILASVMVSMSMMLINSCGVSSPTSSNGGNPAMSVPLAAIGGTGGPALNTASKSPLPPVLTDPVIAALPSASIVDILKEPHANPNASSPNKKPFSQLCGNYEHQYGHYFVGQNAPPAWGLYNKLDRYFLNGFLIRDSSAYGVWVQAFNIIPYTLTLYAIPCGLFPPDFMLPDDFFTGKGFPDGTYIIGGKMYEKGTDPVTGNPTVKPPVPAPMDPTTGKQYPPGYYPPLGGTNPPATQPPGNNQPPTGGTNPPPAGGGGGATLTSLTIEPTIMTVRVGQTASFAAIAHYSDNSSRAVTANSATLWSTQISGIPNITPVALVGGTTLPTGNKAAGLNALSMTTPTGLNAAITTNSIPQVANGIVSSSTKGSIMVMAKYQEGGVTQSAQGTATFNSRYTSISIAPMKTTIYLHSSPHNKTFTATGTFANTSETINSSDINWTSSDSNISPIDANGISLAGSPGTVNIHAVYTPDGTLFSNPDAELNVECRIYTQYQQNAGPWANQLYAYHKSPWFVPPLWTIGQVGCAVTSTAMALSGNGTHIDPGWLDTMMTTPPATANVYATQIFPIYTFYDTGNGVNFTLTLSYFGNVTGTWINFNQDQWINYLNNCKTIITRVHNTRDHYVFIYKYSNGNFIAYDPLYPGEQVIAPARILDGVLCSY